MRTALLLSTVLPLCVLANTQPIKVYSSPSIKAKSIGQLNPNDGYSIQNDWVHVSHKNLTGWVRLQDLKKANSGSWSYQQTFSTQHASSNRDEDVKAINNSIRNAEQLMNSMFTTAPFFSPFERPIIIINQKDNSRPSPHKK
jgi:hypothetical protein